MEQATSSFVYSLSLSTLNELILVFYRVRAVSVPLSSENL